MKKIFKFGILSTTIAPIFAVVACGQNPQTEPEQKELIFNYDSYVKNQNFSATTYNINSGLNDIIEFNNAADINLYWNSWGSITYDYMLKLALLSLANDGSNRSTREVHFAFCPEVKELSHQSNLNAQYLETLLKTRNTKSSVINMQGDVYGNVVEEWKKIIEENPNKKINVWWNSDHIDHINGTSDIKVLDLAGYKNVNLQLIEDGSNLAFLPSILDNKNNQNNFKDVKDVNKFDFKTQYFVQNLFKNVYSWFSASYFNKYKNISGFERIKTFEQKYLSDKLFDFRININSSDVSALTAAEGRTSTLTVGDQRIFRVWPIASGLDWKNAFRTLLNAKLRRPLKSMILLGTYSYDWEDDYIRSVWTRYHNEYNIFYKGHPGHNEHSNFVQNVLLDQEKRDGLYLLQSAIPSEELTRDHFLDGLKFDAVISIDKTSAMDGFPKNFTDSNGQSVAGYDLNKQYLEIALPGSSKPIIVGNPTNPLFKADPASTSGWTAIESWLKASSWI